MDELALQGSTSIKFLKEERELRRTECETSCLFCMCFVRLCACVLVCLLRGRERWRKIERWRDRERGAKRQRERVFV